MSEQEVCDMRELDKLAEESGGYVTPMGEDNIHYDFRKINAYCKEKGIEPIDLTIREISQFILPSS